MRFARSAIISIFVNFVVLALLLCVESMQNDRHGPRDVERQD
jgi:hypothetical protein